MHCLINDGSVIDKWIICRSRSQTTGRLVETQRTVLDDALGRQNKLSFTRQMFAASPSLFKELPECTANAEVEWQL